MPLFVDLTLAPYLVVANKSTEPIRKQNTEGINTAIKDYNGLSAVLLLPYGDIYCERDTPKPNKTTWSIHFDGVSRVSLRGMGMFATTLIQEGVGVLNAEWDLFVIDGCTDIEISNLGMRQGNIQNPDFPGDHNSLINIVATSQNCRNLVFDHLHFGSCIGDAFRLVGSGTAASICENVRLTHFVMETEGHPRGAGGLGRGSRSGVSLQRGFKKVEIGHGFIRGAKNSPFEMEPTGAGINEDLLVHDLIIDNSLGQTQNALTFAGTVDYPLKRLVADDVIVLEGNVMGYHTEDATVSNLTVYTSTAAPSDLKAKPLFSWNQDHNHSNIINLCLNRDIGSPAGPLVLIVPRQATGSITVVAGSNLVDQETITISDGVTSKTFEFDNNAAVISGNTAVAFTRASTAIEVRAALIAAINNEANFNITASISTDLDPNDPNKIAVALTNDRPGEHGNVPITETVAHASFEAKGMIGGGQSIEVKFRGGTWRSWVGAGTELRYFEARGCSRVSVEGVHMQLGAAIDKEYAFSFRSVGDVHSPSLSNIRIESITPVFRRLGTRLAGAVYFAATNLGSITDIRVTDVRAPDAVTTGVTFDNNHGTSLDTSPLLQGCDFTGATNPWLAINSAVGLVFPIIAGNKSTQTWQVGTADPNTHVTAVQGSRYTQQDANNTTEWFKDTSTGNTGWVPSPAGAERRTTNGAASLIKQTTFIAGAGTNVTLGNHFSDGYVKHFIVTAGTGQLTPTSLADGTKHTITWTGRCSFSLTWDNTTALWRVLGTPNGATVT
jgi:hypothetical protein